MFMLFSKPIDMFIFIFTDGQCSLYVCQAKASLLLKDKANYITPYHSKCGIFTLSTSFSFSDLSYDFLKLINNKSSYVHVMLGMLCFHFWIYLTFVKAVTLILKHATLSRTSNLPMVALTDADLDYQKANIDESIQQYLTTCASELSVEQFAGFIMVTNIGLFTLCFLLCLFNT